MQVLEVKCGYACNNNCVFCLNQHQKHYKEFPPDDIVRQIEKSARQGCKNLIISGGEPLISPNFFRIVTFAKEAGFEKIEIQTNARMLCYKSFVGDLLNVKPLQYAFLVSLHFPDKKLYKKYMQSEGFDQAIGGIKNLLQHKLRCIINTVVMKQNIGLLNDITSLLKSIGVERQQFRMIAGHNVRERFCEFVPRISEAAAEIRKVIRENDGTMEFGVHEIPACVLGRDMDRYLTPPTNRERANFVVGNKIVMSDEIDAKQFVFSPRCDACSFRPTCRGIRREYGAIYGLSELKPVKK